MGEEVATSQFVPADFDRFAAHLEDETRLLSQQLAGGLFSEAGYSVGFEIEAWLLDHGFFPNPVNEQLLAAIDNPLVVPELSRFNVELNCDPHPLGGPVLRRSEQALGSLWDACNAVAHGLDANMVMIGTLPVIRDADLNPANMSGQKRYEALNTEILRLRGGRPLTIDIEGRQHVRSAHHDVMLEAATTSFQIHLKVPTRLAARYYNASLMVSGPLLAASANAPFLFGRDVWAETRIPLFEQAIALKGQNGDGRVTFGSGYVDGGLDTVLAENLENYPPLLPLTFDEPREALRHLRLHNGTIWRWNRPLVGFDDDGTPHLRIEHRVMPAGPSMIDMIANAAFYFGTADMLADRCREAEAILPFAAARDNFYAAAKYGLDAEILWLDGRRQPVREVLAELLPLAREGLVRQGVGAGLIDRYLDIIHLRLASGQTGAAWQLAHHQKHGDLFSLTAEYLEHQRSGMPVHEWPL